VGVREADALQEIIERAKQWPIWSADAAGGPLTTNVYAQAGKYGQSLRDIALWVAMRESDRARLQQEINWDKDREYRVDPLPERMAEAFSDLLFGEDPEFKAPGGEDDQKLLDEIVRENDLASELRRWCTECVSEGEIWWHIYVDPAVSAEVPIVEAASRLDVIPYFLGRRVGAAAFVETLFTQDVTIENAQKVIYWRHIEIQTDELVRHFLYQGTWDNLGDRVPLGQTPETAELEPEWSHGLPVMLAGRVPNKLGRDWRLGISDFQGVKDLILDLNESRTIMAENARNTAKARMVVPASALDEDGKFKAGDDVVVAESLDESLDNTGKSGPYAVLEYKFQARELLLHIEDLMFTILSRAGLAEQFVGGGRGGGEGQAFTGTALRTRLIPTTLAASGKGRFWDAALPQIAKALALVSKLPVSEGGLGKEWSNVEDDFVVNRSTVLPEDLGEETQRHVMAVQGEIESIETAVRDMHPEWDEDEIKKELDKIEKQQKPATPDLPPGMHGEPGNPEPGADRVNGTRQPGAGRGVDGQSPGGHPPEVVAGGPRAGA